MRLINNLILISLVLFTAVAISGCNTLKKDWYSTRSVDTISEYENFRQKYPNSMWDKTAQIRIEQLEWEQAKKTDTVDACQAYIDKYGTKAQFYKKAINIIDNKKWELTKKIDTIDAYENHLTAFGHRYGLHYSQAKNRIDDIEWEKAKKKNTASAYTQYLTVHKQSEARHFSEAFRSLLKQSTIQKINFNITNNFAKIPTNKIKDYTAKRFSDALKDAFLFDPDNEGLILELNVIVSAGNWYTTVSYGGVELSRGIYVETTAKLLSHSNQELGKIKHADGWVIETSDQWKCASKSIDLHVGLLLTFFAKNGINGFQIVQVLMKNSYLPLRSKVGNSKNKFTLWGELKTIGAPAVQSLIASLERVSRTSPALEQKNNQIRSRAAFALGKIGDRSAIGPLKKALSDKNQSVRQEASQALEKIKKAGSAAHE